MTMPVPRKKAAAKKPEPFRIENGVVTREQIDAVPVSDLTALPESEVVVTVSGSSSVDGVKPGGRLPWGGDLVRLRGLMLAGHVTVTVGGVQISDGHIVARMEGA